VNINTPRAGSLNFMAQDVCERLGLGFVPTPEYSDRTVEIGTTLSPELICFPTKVLIGASVEALENGADTLVTAAGYGPCRFNYFAEIQRRILEREGYMFRIITFDSPFEAPRDFYRGMRTVLSESRLGAVALVRQFPLTLRKGHQFDEIDKWVSASRGLEVDEGSVDRAAGRCREALRGAFTALELDEVSAFVDEVFEAVELDMERPHIRVGIVGEWLMSMEPYFNFDIDRWLARKGAVVERNLYSSDIFTPWGKNPVLGMSDEEVEREARPYLKHEVGGHGQITVAGAAQFARRGFDAIIHFMPFACLPEVVARTVFRRIKDDFSIPILSISIDEQTGRTGMQTRLEALVDLAWSRRSHKVV
jgi:predicted nucleotide-binding protein (sugar kinase/HSP70/actin superfamily)